jgi:hypothetical protein
MDGIHDGIIEYAVRRFQLLSMDFLPIDLRERERRAIAVIDCVRPDDIAASRVPWNSSTSSGDRGSTNQPIARGARAPEF